LAITASAVAKRVATVEELLGTPLLQRTGKQLQLTAAGKEYLGHVRQALTLLAAVPMHRRAVQRVQRLRVTAPPTFARQVLVPHLESFTAAHPEVELEIGLSVPYLDAPASDADVDIRLGDAAAHGGRVLMHDVVLPMAAPALRARLPPMRTPADLAAAPLLRTPIEPWTTWFRAVGLDWPEPASGMRLIDLGLTLEAALSGQGVALARPTLARPWLETGALQPLFAQAAVPAQQYHLLPHAESGAAPAFAEWLHALCARLAVESQALATR
jgi:DNA-binding transcriptional LysR family regulator